MEKVKTDIPNVEIIFEAHPDHIPIEDCYPDEEQINYVRRRVEQGDLYAHFCAEVYAVFNGEIESGREYLGACCYEDARDFIENSGYFEDMKDTALQNLQAILEQVAGNARETIAYMKQSKRS